MELIVASSLKSHHLGNKTNAVFLMTFRQVALHSFFLNFSSHDVTPAYKTDNLSSFCGQDKNRFPCLGSPQWSHLNLPRWVGKILLAGKDSCWADCQGNSWKREAISAKHERDSDRLWFLVQKYRDTTVPRRTRWTVETILTRFSPENFSITRCSSDWNLGLYQDLS